MQLDDLPASVSPVDKGGRRTRERKKNHDFVCILSDCSLDFYYIIIIIASVILAAGGGWTQLGIMSGINSAIPKIS